MRFLRRSLTGVFLLAVTLALIAWAGEDPKAWYPLDMRFSVAAVPAGQTFVGWDVLLK